MYGKNQSEEHLRKRSASLIGRKKAEGSGKAPIKVEVVDVINNKITIYNTISAAALDLNIRQTEISRQLIRVGGKPYKNQFLFKKVA